MWFSRISISYKKWLQIVQNKIIRFVLGIPQRTHLCCSEFSRVNILPVKYMADQIKHNHMFNIVHGSAPEYLKHSITLSRGRIQRHSLQAVELSQTDVQIVSNLPTPTNGGPIYLFSASQP